MLAMGTDRGASEDASAQPRHVWIINHFALTPDQAGGTRHFELSKALNENGFQVTIIGAGQQHISDRNHVPTGQKWAKEEIEGVSFHWMKTPSASARIIRRVWNNVVFAARTLCRQGLKAQPKPDYVVGTSPDLISALSAYVVAQRMKVPFVLEIRDIWPLSAVQIGQFSTYHPYIVLLGFLERFLYRNADWIVTLLPNAHRHIVPNGGNAEKITWIPNGSGIASRPIAECQAQCENEKFTLMYAGTHGNANNLESLLRAARILKDRGLAENLAIRLIGNGPSKENLKTMAEEWALDFITFEPAVSKVMVQQRLSEADAFCLIFHGHEIYNFGVSANKLYDYLSVGRPIILALNGEYNPVADARAGISVLADDDQALADAIAEMTRTPEDERRAMGKRARAYALKHHSMDGLGQKFANVLNNIQPPN